MRNRRSILLLLLGIALLVAANVALRISGGDAARIVRRTSLADAAGGFTRISIARGAQRVALAKSVRWRLESPFSASADEAVVLKLLDAVSFTRIQDAMSDSELLRLGRTRADLSLEEPRLTLTLGRDAGTTVISFGANTPSGDGVYAAIGGVDSVFVLPVGILEAVDLSVDSLRRRSLFVDGADSVVAFDVKMGVSSRLSFVREGEHWQMDGRPASASRVRGLLDGVLSAAAVDFVWPVGATNETEIASASLLAAYGLDPDSAVAVTFRCQDGHESRVSFGKTSDAGLVYALAQNGGAIVTVPAAVRECVSLEQFSYTDARLFPYEAAAVRSLCLSEGSVEFVLARGEDGSWRLESPVAAAADAETADKVLANALALSAADRRETGVAVTVMTNSAPVIVRRKAVLGDFRFEDLRAKSILRIESGAVRRLVVAHAKEKPTAIVYGRERGAWNVESSSAAGAVDVKAVKSVLAALCPLRALRIVKLKVSAAELDGYGLGDPYLTVAADLDRAESVRRNILIGGVTEGGRFATVGSSDAIFVIPDETVSLFEQPLVGD